MNNGIDELEFGAKILYGSESEYRLNGLSWIEAVHYDARQFEFYVRPLSDGQAYFKIEGETLLV